MERQTFDILVDRLARRASDFWGFNQAFQSTFKKLIDLDKLPSKKFVPKDLRETFLFELARSVEMEEELRDLLKETGHDRGE